MNEREYLAKDFAYRWTKPACSDEAQKALAHAYEQGWKDALEQAASVCSFLLTGVGGTEVDPETGKSVRGSSDD